MIPILKISCNVLKKVNLVHRKQWLFDCDHFDDKNVMCAFHWAAETVIAIYGEGSLHFSKNTQSSWSWGTH